jgi:long-chain acyl-CoA synthetase
MGNYIWKSYNEVDRLAISFATGLSTLGLKPKDKFCIFAETRAEWFISSIAAFKNNYTSKYFWSSRLCLEFTDKRIFLFAVVTLYATLGDDAVIHGLRETECAAVITSHELLPKFKSILKETPHVKHIVYMEHPLVKTDTSGFPTDVTIHAFCDVIDKGRNLTIRE